MISVQHSSFTLNFFVIFLSCKADAFKGESPSFPSHCYLQQKLFPLSAQVFSQNNYNIFEFKSRASTQPKAFLPIGVIFRSHIARAVAVHSTCMNASGSEAKTTKPVSQSSLLVTVYKTNVPLPGYAFRARGWFKLTRNSQAQISARWWFSCSSRWLKVWMLQASSGASKLSNCSCHIFLRFLRLCLRKNFILVVRYPATYWRVVSISIVKQTRCTILEFIEYYSTCFGRSFRPSSGVQDRTHSIRYMSYRLVDYLQSTNLYDIYLMLYVQSWTPDDGRKDRPKHVGWYSVNSKIVHLVGFAIEIYHDARSHERQKCCIQCQWHVFPSVMFSVCSFITEFLTLYAPN